MRRSASQIVANISHQSAILISSQTLIRRRQVDAKRGAVASANTERRFNRSASCLAEGLGLKNRLNGRRRRSLLKVMMRSLMKKVLLSGVALALLSGSAVAADLPSRKGPPPAFVPPPPMWTGFYAGLNAGYSWGGSNSFYTSTANLFDNYAPSDLEGAVSALSQSGVGPASADGFIGGGQIGYNWQFSNVFVAGIEADIQGAGVRGSGSFSNAGVDTDGTDALVSTVAHSKKLDSLGTVRGRLGYLLTPTCSPTLPAVLHMAECQPTRAFRASELVDNLWRPMAGGHRPLFRHARRLDGWRRPRMDVHAQLELCRLTSTYCSVRREPPARGQAQGMERGGAVQLANRPRSGAKSSQVRGNCLDVAALDGAGESLGRAEPQRVSDTGLDQRTDGPQRLVLADAGRAHQHGGGIHQRDDVVAGHDGCRVVDRPALGRNPQRLTAEEGDDAFRPGQGAGASVDGKGASRESGEALFGGGDGLERVDRAAENTGGSQGREDLRPHDPAGMQRNPAGFPGLRQEARDFGDGAVGDGDQDSPGLRGERRQGDGFHLRADECGGGKSAIGVAAAYDQNGLAGLQQQPAESLGHTARSGDTDGAMWISGHSSVLSHWRRRWNVLEFLVGHTPRARSSVG